MILIADSGSTKTDWCLSENGTVAATVSTQGINPFHQSEQQISAIVRGELLPALAGRSVGAIFFYGSGCREECIPAMQGVLGSAFPGCRRIEVGGDLLGAARALCGAGEGIACILGTGANSCLYDGSRIVMNTPPLGYILGDEGSGTVLGRIFINALFKGLPGDGGSAGRSDTGTLREAFYSHTGMTMADVIDRVYRAPLANRFLASLAPFIHSHLSVPAVRTLVIDNFRAFFRRNVSQYGRTDLPVNAVGSIAHYFSAELAEAACAEGFAIGRIERSPMAGLVAYHDLQ